MIIFMNRMILRTGLFYLRFARMWNSHSIRKQPNAVCGKPCMLYHWPQAGVRDYGLKPDRELLSRLHVKSCYISTLSGVGSPKHQSRTKHLQDAEKSSKN